MRDKRKTNPNAEMKENDRNNQTSADKNKIQSEKMRYKNSDKIYE